MILIPTVMFLEVIEVNGTPIGSPITTASGTVVMNSDGTYTYTPNTGFFGLDSFTYTVTDSAGNIETTTVEITVNSAELGIAKSASDAVPNPINSDNFDITFTLVVENLGNVSLSNLTLVDDLMAMFGGAFVSSTSPVIANFFGTGTAPTINGSWVNDTSQNILNGGSLEVGASFDVVFTVTLDPDNGGIAQGLSNQASGSGQGVNPDGSPMLDSNGDLAIASDVSDDGSDPAGENGSDNGDGVFGNDATPIIIADLGIAKTTVGEPVLLFIGNYVVTYQVVVQNTGTVTLTDLSLLEDLTTQFDGAFVSATNLTLASGPTDFASNITANSGGSAGFNGSTNIELLDASNANTLAVGDSFTLQFEVEIDPRAVTGSVGNQVSGSGNAVDANGQPIVGADGNPIAGTDLSDSGADPSSTNPNDPDDNGSSSDRTLFSPPPLQPGEISGTVFLDDNGNGILDPGEGGIEGVTVQLLGVDVFGNDVDITMQTDSNGQFSFTDLNAGTYQLIETQPDGFNDGQDASGSAGTIGNDEFSGIVLNFGQSLTFNNFGERLSGTSGSPARLPALLPIFRSPIGNLISSFLGSPGPIYSGIPINTNANPLSLDSGRPVTGGYVVGLDDQSDCGCVEFTDPCEAPIDECSKAVDDANPVMQDEVAIEYKGDAIVEDCCETIVPFGEEVKEVVSVECEPACPAIPVSMDDCPSASIPRPSFLKRFSNWLKR